MDGQTEKQMLQSALSKSKFFRIRVIIRYTDKHIGLIMTLLCSLLHWSKPSP